MPPCRWWVIQAPTLRAADLASLLTKRGADVHVVLTADAQQFKSAVKQQVQPIKEQADEAFKTCLVRASQLEVYAPAVLGLLIARFLLWIGVAKSFSQQLSGIAMPPRYGLS